MIGVNLNMLLDRLKSCVAKMDKILKLITSMSEHDKIISVQDHLSILQLKCIEKLYDGWSDDAIEALINKLRLLDFNLKKTHLPFELCKG